MNRIVNSDVKIEPLISNAIDDFFEYLTDHVSDNGKNNMPLFLPISKEDLALPPKLIDGIRVGQWTAVHEPGWRRVLIASNKKNEIIGHIDLKSHEHSYAHHRAVLGMGVHRAHRKRGLGSLLIETLLDWTKKEAKLEWIDLQVLSENTPAIRLYNKMGFHKVGEIEDMFRIDGNSHNYLMMTKKIL